VQSCLEKALTQHRNLAQAPYLRPWLFSILYHQFIDGERRKSRFQRILALFTAEESYSASAEDLAITDATLASFAHLPTEQRALLLLITLEGLTYQEAADTLGIPIGTVMSRLSRARQQLHDMAEGAPTGPRLRRLK